MCWTYCLLYQRAYPFVTLTTLRPPTPHVGFNEAITGKVECLINGLWLILWKFILKLPWSFSSDVELIFRLISLNDRCIKVDIQQYLHTRSLLYPWTQSDLTWRPGINWWRPSDNSSPQCFYYNLMTCTLKQNVATSSVFTKKKIGSARFVHKKDRTDSAQTDPIFLNRAEPSRSILLISTSARNNSIEYLKAIRCMSCTMYYIS